MNCTVFLIKVLASKYVGCRCNFATRKDDATPLRTKPDKGRVLITSKYRVDSYLVCTI